MRNLVLTLAFLTVASPAMAAIAVIEHSIIDRDQVLVGDLFTTNDTLAAKPVGDAPAPGKSNTYDVNALRRVARAYDIAWTPSRLDTRAIVQRASTEISNKQILDIVRGSLVEHTKSAVDEADSVEILLDRRTLSLHLPASIKQPVASIIDVDYNPADYRFKGTLMVEDADGSMDQPMLIPVTGRALPQVNVPVLTRNIGKGGVIAGNDVELIAVNANKLGQDILTSVSDLVGKEARRDLNEGQVLRNRDFRPQQLVKRGGLVNMVILAGQMQITARGRALSDAGVGDAVRVLNLQSNRTIEGTVLPDGNVSISPSI